MRALISGVTGQDGSYLAELLLGKNYEVHGILRRSSSFNTARIDRLHADETAPEARLFLHYGDVTDSANIARILALVRPDEVYHLAAQSHVAVSFELPEYTAQVDAVGTLRMLEAIRALQLPCRFYNASTSEIFGDATPPQNEATAFRPRSPYGCAKLYAHWMTVNYREAYGMFAVNGILFNHESSRRSENFVTRKIVKGLVGIARDDKQGVLRLGNLEARRDWGHARDYVRAMWMMLSAERPVDYVVGTGVSRTVREFVGAVAAKLGMALAWRGTDAFWGKRRVITADRRHFRPLEVAHLVSDAARIRDGLGWRPEISFDALVEEMIEAEWTQSATMPPAIP